MIVNACSFCYIERFSPQLDHSPGAPLSSPEEGSHHGGGGGSNHSGGGGSQHHAALMANGGAGGASGGNSLPLSDNNVSTTNDYCGNGGGSGAGALPAPIPAQPEQPPAVAAFCNVDEPEDINVSQKANMSLL